MKAKSYEEIMADIQEAIFKAFCIETASGEDLDKLAEISRNPKCECGNKENPVGQGHSDWCDLYSKEF